MVTKDVKIVNDILIDNTTKKIVKITVGSTLGEVNEELTEYQMVKEIDKGQVYQVQAYDSGDPANVVVKDMSDGRRILTTNNDGNTLNNLKDRVKFVDNEAPRDRNQD